MKNPQLGLNEISTMSGFDSLSYFGKVFKKSFLLTPSDFRRKIIN